MSDSRALRRIVRVEYHTRQTARGPAGVVILRLECGHTKRKDLSAFKPSANNLPSAINAGKRRLTNFSARI
jgi:hypothetical protein